MAEPSRPPSLPSASDPVPYVPVSWMAVAALAVAGLFVVVLFGLAVDAYQSKRPLLVEGLLLLPVVAVVLSFAARRLIRNSEGTRTGEGLANAAWWTAVVVGMGYVAYLFAIDFAVRRDASREVERWVKAVFQDDVPQAFWHTIEPGRRGTFKRQDGTFEADRMEREMRPQYVAFRQCDVVQVAERNFGACEFEPGSLRDWTQTQTVVNCSFTGVVACPEGRFSVVVPLRGFEGVVADGVNSGRQWMVVGLPSGYVQKAELTPYGWTTTDLRQQGSDFAREFIRMLSTGPGMQPYAYMAYVRPGGDPKEWTKALAATPARAAAVGAYALLGVRDIFPEYEQFVSGKFFTPPVVRNPGDKLAVPKDATAEDRNRFLTIWNTVGVLPAGTRLRETTDKNVTMFLSDTVVEVRVPVELPLPSTAGDSDVARGRLVVACTDPDVLAELKRLRDGAKAAGVSERPPESFGKKAAAWRVIRVESDLKAVPQPKPGDPGGPPG